MQKFVSDWPESGNQESLALKSQEPLKIISAYSIHLGLILDGWIFTFKIKLTLA
jgi:hypothetical protein